MKILAVGVGSGLHVELVQLVDDDDNAEGSSGVVLELGEEKFLGCLAFIGFIKLDVTPALEVVENGAVESMRCQGMFCIQVQAGDVDGHHRGEDNAADVSERLKRGGLANA